MLSNLSTVHCPDNEAMSRSECNQLLLKTAYDNLGPYTTTALHGVKLLTSKFPDWGGGCCHNVFWR